MNHDILILDYQGETFYPYAMFFFFFFPNIILFGVTLASERRAGDDKSVKAM